MQFDDDASVAQAIDHWMDALPTEERGRHAPVDVVRFGAMVGVISATLGFFGFMVAAIMTWQVLVHTPDTASAPIDEVQLSDVLGATVRG